MENNKITIEKTNMKNDFILVKKPLLLQLQFISKTNYDNVLCVSFFEKTKIIIIAWAFFSSTGV